MTDAESVSNVAWAHLHGDAQAVLERWSAPDVVGVPGEIAARQAMLRDAYLAHLAAHPDGVAKAGPPAHLTASCIVFDHELRRVLLTHHRRADAWFQLGGHLEASDESLRGAAYREATEESGIAGLVLTVAPVQLNRHALGAGFGRCAEHLDVRYASRAPRDATPVVSAESKALAWFAIDQLPPGRGKAIPEASLVELVGLGRAVLLAD